MTCWQRVGGKWIAGGMAVAVLALLISAGCRKFPNEATPQETVIQGTYVGNGNLDTTGVNVSLGINGPDSLGRYIGQIGYRGLRSTLDSISRDSTGDTLRFSYARDNVIHKAWAQVYYTGMLLHFTQPTGIDSFRLNKEFDGYNLSGVWHGLMYSNFVQQTRNATMTMNQEGSTFIGSMDVTLIQSAQFTFSNGAYSGNAFQMSGSVRMSGTDSPVSFTGNYVNQDSATGYWQIGTNENTVDTGTFALGRSFN